MKNFTFNNIIMTDCFSKIIRLLFVFMGIMGVQMAFSQTFPATGTFRPPAGVTSVTVQAWGAGGRGGTRTSDGAGGGGGGGAFSQGVVTPVSNGTTYTITVGIGSTTTAAGGDSWFGTATTLMAKGGSSCGSNTATGAQGGQASAGFGTIKWNGGWGRNTASSRGGGGGAAAGTAAAGADVTQTSNNTGATGVNGGGSGGNGRTGGTQGDGLPGVAPGGGGGGAYRTSGTQDGGKGGDGQVIVNYGTCPVYSLSSPASASTVCNNTASTVTLTGTAASLPVGTYTVTFNRTVQNAATGLTATMTVATAGTGTFSTGNLATAGTTTITVTSLASGLSSLSATPLCSSSIVANVNSMADVNVVSIPATPGTITGAATVCEASTGNAYSIGTVTYATSYTWAVPTGWNITSGQGTNAITATAGSAGQNGNITVTATNSTCVTPSSPRSLAVTVVGTPAIPGAISGIAAVCPGITTLTYSVVPVTYATSYNWNVPTGWTITAGAGTNSITVTSGAIGEDGNITVSANNLTCGTTGPAQTKAVTVPSAPLDFAVGAAASTVCQGTGTNITLAGSESGVTYELRTVGGSLITTVAGTGSPIVLPTGPLAGTTTFRVDAIKIVGCFTTMSLTASVTATPAPVVDAIANVPHCNNDVTSAIILSSSPVGSTFTWTNNMPAIGLAVSGSGDIPSFTATNGTNAQIVANIAVTAFDGACYSALPTTFAIAVNPTPNVTNNPSYPACSGVNPNIALTANTPSSFTWTIGSITGSITGATDGAGSTLNQVLNNPSDLTAGTVEYIVTPTSTVGSCAGLPFTITITVNPTPTISTANTAEICSGTSPSIGLVSSAASNFAWTLGTNNSTSGGSVGSGSNINQTLTNPSNSIIGSLVYNVIATTTVGTCQSAQYPITVTVNPRPTVTTANTKAICSGDNSNIALTASTASSFTWTLGTGTGSSISGANAGSGTAINDVLTNPTNNTVGTVVYNVTPTANGCAALSPYAITVTVRPSPTVTTGSAFSLCSGTGPNRALTASVASTYAWTIGANLGGITGASAGSGTPINQTLTNPSNSAAADIAYIVTPTSTTGSCPGSPFTITFTVNPTPVVTTTSPLSVCNGDATNITLTSSTPSTFAWPAGSRTGVQNGTTPSGSGSLINQTPALTTATTAGQVIYRVTATAAAGSCPSTLTNFTVAVNPKPTVSTVNSNICSGVPLNIALASSTPSSFAWLTGANSGPISGGVDGAGSTITDVLVNPSNTIAGSLVYNVTPTATLGNCVGTTKPITVTVRPAPAVTNLSNYEICNATNTNISLTSSITSNFTWTIANNTGPLATPAAGSAASGGKINQTLTNPSDAIVGSVQYLVTPTSTAAGTCVGAVFPITVTVNPTPTITTGPSASICSGTGPNINLTSSAGSNFAWTLGARTNVSGGVAGNGTTINDILTNTTNNANGSLIYNVTATTTTGTCPSAITPITVTVTPTPVVTNPNTATACNGTSPNIALTASTPSTFTWTVGTVSPGITGANPGSSAGPSGSTIDDVLNNSSNSASGTVEYIITPTSTTNTCPGAPYTITVTVFPTPEVNSVATANACSSIPAIPVNYDISSTVLGANYTWGRLAVAGITEGTVAGQTADPILETLTNTTGASIPVTYKITPIANGCSGPVFDLVVTVMPHTDAVITSHASDVICTPAIINYPITSTGGPFDNYRWNRVAVPGITPVSALNQTTSTISETLTSSSPSNATVTYAITAMNNGCPGDVFNYVVTVRPTLALQNQVTAACSDQEFIFGPADASSGVIPADTKFTWNLSAAGGLTGGADMAIEQDSVYQTLTNSTSGLQTATYIVNAISPTACVSGAFILTVNVDPTPTVNAAVAGSTNICSGTSIPTITVTNPNSLSGTTFTWSRANTANLTGMGATGNGAIINGTLTNTSNTDQIETFMISAQNNGCATTTTVTITVRPSANALATPASQTAICSGDAIASIIISNPNGVLGADYTWTRNKLVELSGLESGTGNTIAGSLINLTGVQQTTTFTITPAAAGCDGSPITATVIVKARPQVTASRISTAAICSGSPISTISVGHSNSVVGTTYSWTRTNGTINTGALQGMNASGAGATINGTLVNTTATQQIASFTIRATSGTCYSDTIVDVIVNPAPLISALPASQNLCNGSTMADIILSDNLSGTTYDWTRTNGDLASGIVQGLAAAGSGATITGAALTNTTTTTRITTFNIVATASVANGGCTSSAAVPVTVYAPFVAPVIGSSQTLCTGVNPTAFLITTAPRGGTAYTYEWQSGTDGTNFPNTNLSAATSYQAPIPATQTFYRLIVTSGNSCGSVTSNVVNIESVANSSFTVDFDPALTTVCSGSVVSKPFSTSHATNKSIRYSWSADPTYVNPSVGGPIGSTGNIINIIILQWRNSTANIDLTFTNNTNASVTQDVTVYPGLYTYSASATTGFQCSLAPTTYSVRIRPVVIASASAPTETICSGTSPATTFGSNVTDATTNFTWSRTIVGGLTSASTSGTITNVAANTTRTLASLSGALTNSTSGALTTRYTITPTSNGCPGAAIIVDVTVNGTINPGSVAADQTICAADDPVAFTNAASATGGVTPFYQWQSSTGGCAGTFTDVSGANSATLDIPAGLTVNTTYRRQVSFTNVVTCASATPTNCVTIYVNTLTPGSITGDQTICGGGSPVIFGSTAATAAGAITYQWQSKVGAGSFANLTDSVNATMTAPPGLAVTTTYRRMVTTTLNGHPCSDYSNEVTVTVNTVTAGTIGGGATFCGATDPGAFTQTLGTGTALTYKWISTLGLNCSGTFGAASGPTGTSAAYNPPLLTATTTYRRVAISTVGALVCRDTTTCVTDTILNINPGTIGTTQAVCSGDTPLPFTSTADATAGGLTDYRWESSPTPVAGPWSPIAGTNSNAYAYPNPITDNIYFRRVTFGDIDGTPCEVATGSISVFENDPRPGQVDAPICNSVDPLPFTITTAATATGLLGYQWQSSATDCSGLWSNIPGPGTTSATYDPSGLTPGIHYYRRVVSSLLAGKTCYADGNCVIVHAYAGTPGNWAGTTSSDWFDCANWEAGVLPDNLLSATIPVAAIRQPIIDDGSTFAPIDKMARTNNLTVEGTINFATSASLLNTAGNLQILPVTGNINMPTGGTIQLAGNWVNDRGAAGLTGVGKVSLVGTGTQTINTNSAPQTFYDLSMDKTGGSATLLADVTVDHQLILNTGALTTTNTPGLLTLPIPATYVGGSSASFINGPMARVTDNSVAGSAEFIFPIGKTGNYQPAAILPVSTSASPTTFTAEFFPGNPASTFNHPFLGLAPIGALLVDKYWVFERPSGTGTARVVLNYAATTAPAGWVLEGGAPLGAAIPVNTNVAVAHDNGSQWSFTKGTGNFNNSGPKYEARYYNTNGWIYSDEMTSFSPFTIGFGNNTILPIKLIGFEGRLLGADGALSWKVSSASDLAGFELQYSTTGTTYKKLADIPANGGTVYSYLDKQLPIGARFYRLLVKEKGGNSLHSAVIMLTLDGQKTSITGLSHTIVREQSVTGKIVSAKAQGIRALISDVSGRQIAERRGRLQAGNNQWLINTGFLASGMYFVTILTDDGVKATLQFVKE